ncbi:MULTISPECIES: peptide ABC transporter substrate-binding protein [unclassified Salinisphaera]|uniref:peptide ABC transporter substrate-binding protein n=1 Tax=unclassified Salinisphaera TaxID=2649847 RepID=UPI003340452E
MNKLRALGCVLFAALLLAACSSEESAKFPVENTPEIRDDGTTVLRRGNGAEPESLDPHQARSVPAANILRDLYSGLVQISPAGEIEPADAESWEMTDNGLVYTFKLRKDLHWSNGEPLTAQDYVYSLRRSVDPATGSPYAQLHAPIANAKAIIAGDKPPAALGVRALDDHSLEITLTAPTPYFLGTLAHSISYPVYKPAVEAHGAAFSQPGNAVTNGAYKIESWRVNSMIALERNRQYWDDAQTAIGRVEYYPITNQNSALSRYQAGELDWATSVPIPRLEAIKKYIPAQLHTQPTLGVYYYGLNVKRPPFKDAPELRRALSMAIDRRTIVDKITRGDEIPAYGWIPPVVEGYAGAQFSWTKLSDSKREAKARELYEKAGYSESKPLQIEIRYNSGEGNKKIASVIAAMWRSVLGADVTLRNEEWKVFLDNVRQGNTEAYRLAWIGDYDDPNTFFELMNSKFGLNGTGYASAEYDRLQEKQAHMPDGPERMKIMKKAESVLLADSPIIPIYFYVSKYLIKDYVKGFEGNPLDSYYSKDLSIEP